MGLLDLPKLGLQATAGNTLLDALSQNLLVEGLWYRQQTVPLDGYHFRNCRFDGCTLSVTTPRFVMENCVIDEKTEILFGTDLVKVIQLFNSRQPEFGPAPPFVPQQNDDGTFSIGA